MSQDSLNKVNKGQARYKQSLGNVTSMKKISKTKPNSKVKHKLWKELTPNCISYLKHGISKKIHYFYHFLLKTKRLFNNKCSNKRERYSFLWQKGSNYEFPLYVVKGSICYTQFVILILIVSFEMCQNTYKTKGKGRKKSKQRTFHQKPYFKQIMPRQIVNAIEQYGVIKNHFHLSLILKKQIIVEKIIQIQLIFLIYDIYRSKYAFFNNSQQVFSRKRKEWAELKFFENKNNKGGTNKKKELVRIGMKISGQN